MRRPLLIYAVYIKAGGRRQPRLRFRVPPPTKPRPGGGATAVRRTPPSVPSADYFASQALTLPGFAFTQTAAALSGFIFLPEIRFATVF